MTAPTTLCLEPTSDPIAAPVLAGILETVLGVYDGLPDVDGPCAAGAVAGASAAVDRGIDTASGCCGQLWVRLVNLYPSRNFPEQDPGPARGFLSWAVVVEVGIARPAPIVRDVDGTAILPSMAEEQAAADRLLIDSAVLRHALLAAYGKARDVGIVLGAWSPFGPDGGIVGGAYAVTVQVP